LGKDTTQYWPLTQGKRVTRGKREGKILSLVVHTAVSSVAQAMEHGACVNSQKRLYACYAICDEGMRGKQTNKEGPNRNQNPALCAGQQQSQLAC
jgi:hypothetical protein